MLDTAVLFNRVLMNGILEFVKKKNNNNMPTDKPSTVHCVLHPTMLQFM